MVIENPDLETTDLSIILTAFHEVMAAVPYVQKTGHNAHFNYAFASEADVLDKLRPAMIAAGLLLIPSVKSYSLDEKGRAFVEIEVTMAHKSGAIWPEKIIWRGCGQDTQDKMIAKAITSAQKYGLLKTFQIETGSDPDKDGEQKTGRAAGGSQSGKHGRAGAPEPKAGAPAPQLSPPNPAAISQTVTLSTEQQRITLHALLKRKGIPDDEYHDQFLQGYSASSSKELTYQQAGALIQMLSKMPDMK